MSNSVDLIAKINDYVSYRIELRDLESWLVPRLPVLLAQPGSEVEKLTAAVELFLYELHAGIRTERSVRTKLNRLLPPPEKRVMSASRVKDNTPSPSPGTHSENAAS